MILVTADYGKFNFLALGRVVDANLENVDLVHSASVLNFDHKSEGICLFEIVES